MKCQKLLKSSKLVVFLIYILLGLVVVNEVKADWKDTPSIGETIVGDLKYKPITKELAGRKYKPNELGRVDIIINTSFFDNLNALKTDFTNRFEYQTNTKIMNWGVDYLENVSFLNETKERVCVPYTKDYYENDTIEKIIDDNCTYITNKKIDWKYDWTPIRNLKQFEKQKWDILDFWYIKNPTLGESYIDIIPIIKEYEMSKLAWSNSSFLKCRNITMRSEFVMSNQSNFVAYINMNSTAFSGMKLDRDDFRIVNKGCGDGGIVIPYGIENYTLDNIYVKFNTSLSTDEDILNSVYYVYADAENGEDMPGVYDVNYKGVYLMNSLPYPADVTGITTNGTDQSISTMKNGTDTIFGTAIEFDGINDWILTDFNANTAFGGGAWTVDGLVWFDDYDASMAVYGGGGVPRFYLQWDITDTEAYLGIGNHQTTTGIDSPIGTWIYFALTYDGSSLSDYYQNISSSKLDWSIGEESVSNTVTGLGAVNDGGAKMDGRIDELRFSNIVRPLDYLNATYQMILGNLIRIEIEESAPPPPPTTTTTIPSKANWKPNPFLDDIIKTLCKIPFICRDDLQPLDYYQPTLKNITVGDHIIVDKEVRSNTTLYRRYYHLSVGGFDPGASGATWVNPSSDTTGGWRLNAVGEVLVAGTDVHSDWDGVSNITIDLTFVLNTAGNVNDTVDFKLVSYYNGVGDTSTKTQTIEVATNITDGTQYTVYKTEFVLNYNEVSNVIDAGDKITIILNLETDTSEIDDIVVTQGSFYYNTTHLGIEGGDI